MILALPRDGWYPIVATWLPFLKNNPTYRFYIDPTRKVKWLKTVRPNGCSTYAGLPAKGAKGKPRVAKVNIAGKMYLRHRLVAIAALGMTQKQYYDENIVVMHKKRRGDGEEPDDRPKNLRIGTTEENRNDSGNKKGALFGSMHPVTMQSATTGEAKEFESQMSAAEYIGVNSDKVCKAVHGNLKTPLGNGMWTVTGDASIQLDDEEVVLLSGTTKTYMSRTQPVEFFEKNASGMYVRKTFSIHENGYMRIKRADGTYPGLHVVVFETMYPNGYADKLATLPLGSSRKDIDIDHIDGDPTNNDPSNLRALSKSEHARKNAFGVDLLDGPLPGGKPMRSFECAADVVAEIRGTDGRVLHASNVRKVCRGEYAKTGGLFFTWTKRKI